MNYLHGIDTSMLSYGISENKNIVWITHIIIGCFFIAIASIYLYYKDKEEKDIPFNLQTLNQAVYIILLILGSIMVIYHGLILDKKWLSSLVKSSE